MSSSIRQGFTFPRSDVQRAKTAAVAAGLSMNEWMRRTVRAALDGTPAAPTVAALDPALTERFAALLDRLERQGEAGEQRFQTAAATVDTFGLKLSKLAAAMAAAVPKSAQPSA